MSREGPQRPAGALQTFESGMVYPRIVRSFLGPFPWLTDRVTRRVTLNRKDPTMKDPTMNPCPVYCYRTNEMLPGTASEALKKAFEEHTLAYALMAIFDVDTGLWEPNTKQGSRPVYIER